MLKILFTGGGTGGHTYPIIAVARELQSLAQKNNIAVELSFAGPSNANAVIIRQEGIKTYWVPTGKLRRYAAWQTVGDVIKASFGFFYALFLVWWLMPDAIFAKGGFGSLAVGLAGRIYGIPMLVHDSDSVPGLTTRLLGKIASRVAISFPGAASFFAAKKTVLLGNPIRQSLLGGSKQEAKTAFKLKGDRPLIFVTGGSQGSQHINEIVSASLEELLKTYEIIHQVGPNNEETFTKNLKEIYGIEAASQPYYHVKGYLDEQEEASVFAVCDMVVARAGAGNIYEIAAAGKPSILIPLAQAASDHQRENAFFYARTGAALVIEEANLTPHILINEIKGIGESKNRSSEMAKAAKAFAKLDAAAKIAQGLLELAL